MKRCYSRTYCISWFTKYASSYREVYKQTALYRIAFPNWLNYYSRNAQPSLRLIFNQQRPWSFELWSSSLSTPIRNSAHLNPNDYTHPLYGQSPLLQTANSVMVESFCQAQITLSINSLCKVLFLYFIIMLFYMLPY